MSEKSGKTQGLIQWLQSDGNKQKQMKILVIDDEADRLVLTQQMLIVQRLEQLID